MRGIISSGLVLIAGADRVAKRQLLNHLLLRVDEAPDGPMRVDILGTDNDLELLSTLSRSMGIVVEDDVSQRNEAELSRRLGEAVIHGGQQRAKRGESKILLVVDALCATAAHSILVWDARVRRRSLLSAFWRAIDVGVREQWVTCIVVTRPLGVDFVSEIDGVVLTEEVGDADSRAPFEDGSLRLCTLRRSGGPKTQRWRVSLVPRTAPVRVIKMVPDGFDETDATTFK
ncbi:hypothetical protein HK101_005397, partial [Irineochytrium annulatum]